MAIDKWEDAGDWSSIDAIRGTKIYDRILAICKATTERSYAQRGEYSPPSGYDPLYRSLLGDYYINGALFYGYGSMREVDWSMLELIPLYVNHTDNNGDWNGVSSNCAPRWSLQSILDAIGDNALVPTGQGLDIATWLFQRYKILNMLRWASWERPWPGQEEQYPSNYYSKFGSGETRSQALDNFNSSSLLETKNAFFIRQKETKYPGEHSVSVSYSVLTLPDFLSNIDLYIYAFPESYYSSYTYENNDYPIAANTWGRAYTGTNNKILNLGSDYVSTTSPPVMYSGWRSDAYSGHEPLIVTKPLFAFQNWE